MNDLKDSVVKSLDGTGLDIFPYLPYLLQDLREIGTDPLFVSEMLNDFVEDLKPLKILDLGCGKGAVSVRLAKDYNCQVFGIDALPEFVESAKDFAIEKGVYDRCLFTQGDIREQYLYCTGYDVVILGALGSVLGNTQETLQKVSGCLKDVGYVVLDDSYIPESSDYVNENCTSRKEFLNQIHSSGFGILCENIFSPYQIVKQNEVIFSAIKNRTEELSYRYPEKASFFNEYLQRQEIENEALESKLVCGVWLLDKV